MKWKDKKYIYSIFLIQNDTKVDSNSFILKFVNLSGIKILKFMNITK